MRVRGCGVGVSGSADGGEWACRDLWEGMNEIGQAPGLGIGSWVGN